MRVLNLKQVQLQWRTTARLKQWGRLRGWQRRRTLCRLIDGVFGVRCHSILKMCLGCKCWLLGSEGGMGLKVLVGTAALKVLKVLRGAVGLLWLKCLLASVGLLRLQGLLDIVGLLGLKERTVGLLSVSRE